MSKRSSSRGKLKQKEKRLELIRQLWGDDAVFTWDRLTNDGFTTIPRYLPLVGRFMDELSNGAPLSSTYMALWCRVFDEGLVSIQNKDCLAVESGFSSERGVSTWTARMRKLEELGFISSRSSGAGDFSHVLIVHPIVAVRHLIEKRKIDNRITRALKERIIEVGAEWDIEDERDDDDVEEA
ncbi:MAG: hypothetical protein ACRCYD_02280 [Plesiomonas sp.]